MEDLTGRAIHNAVDFANNVTMYSKKYAGTGISIAP
ncbi:MAG: hypothetical protein ACI9ZF_003113 [Bradyrhizobium sp.]|jgi:hypothetical protein